MLFPSEIRVHIIKISAQLTISASSRVTTSNDTKNIEGLPLIRLLTLPFENEETDNAAM